MSSAVLQPPPGAGGGAGEGVFWHNFSTFFGVQSADFRLARFLDVQASHAAVVFHGEQSLSSTAEQPAAGGAGGSGARGG